MAADQPRDHRDGNEHRAAAPTGEAWLGEGFPPDLTADLAAAFSAQADRFEPSDDSYVRLAEAVEAKRPSPARWLRPVAAAAAVLVTLGLGASLLAGRGTQSVGTGPGAEQVAIEQPDGQAEDRPPTESSQPPDDVERAADPDGESGDDSAGDGTNQTTTDEAQVDGDLATPPTRGPVPLTGPVRSSELSAAQAFLDLLRMPYGRPELVDGQVVVRSYLEGGVESDDGPVVAILTVESTATGFAVTSATSGMVTIDEVSGDNLDEGRLEITGTGAGFEGDLELRAMAAFDNRVLAVGGASAGGAEGLAPYRGDLAVAGAEHGWIVVSSLGGADGVLEPFAAKLVSYRSGPDPTNYGVVRVPSDDPVDGLSLRAAPGASSSRLAVLPAGSDGVRRADEFPVPVGEDLWWAVTTAEGPGWVNSRFLASVETIADEALLAVAGQLGAGQQWGFVARPDLPLIRRAPVAIGSAAEPRGVGAGELSDQQSWDQPGSGNPETGQSLSELYRFAGWPGATVEPNGTLANPADQAAVDRYFAGVPSLLITTTAPDDSSGAVEQTVVFVERTAGGRAEIIGMLSSDG